MLPRRPIVAEVPVAPAAPVVAPQPLAAIERRPGIVVDRRKPSQVEVEGKPKDEPAKPDA